MELSRTKSQCFFLWRERKVADQFRTGVSLHSHTLHSLESLFSRISWRPPLIPKEALRVESKQVENVLGLAPLVSITDHDNIDAFEELEVLEGSAQHAVSVEWTVPFGPTFFHLGLHNLPPRRCQAIMRELAAYTSFPNQQPLWELLEALGQDPEVLVVFNHPLWDESAIGVAAHHRALGRFIERHGRYMHALELNGLRPWAENRAVMRLSEETGFPLVSGGDRHGREPNAVVNLTRAECFGEFVHEVRYDRQSQILFMPQYRKPLSWRIFQTVLDVIRAERNPSGRAHCNPGRFDCPPGHSDLMVDWNAWPELLSGNGREYRAAGLDRQRAPRDPVAAGDCFLPQPGGFE